MNKLLLDTKLLENKGNPSKIWGVPIKTKLSPKKKRPTSGSPHTVWRITSRKWSHWTNHTSNTTQKKDSLT